LSFDPTESHVWKSTDSGATWVGLDVAGTTLPDIPVHSLVVDPTNTSRLYIGTDLGVFVSSDGGSTWAVENTGFPNVITESLVVNGANLYAFTHGRGAWRVALTSTTPTVSVGLKTPTSIAYEGSNALVEVQLLTSNHAPSAGGVTVNYQTADGTAIAGTDYTGQTSSVSFPGGSPHGAIQTISIPIPDNTVVEPAKTFKVNLTGATGAGLGAARTHTVTVQDD